MCRNVLKIYKSLLYQVLKSYNYKLNGNINHACKKNYLHILIDILIKFVF